MNQVFALAKANTAMEPAEISRLLQRPEYEARLSAVSIMDFQARSRKTTDARRKELFDLYIDQHDRIDEWGMVDRAAPWVVGGYLFTQGNRDVLYHLARSEHWWERRTAIVSTYFFIRKNDLDDTFRLAEVLAHDGHELVQKAVGGWVREAGKRDGQRLRAFLDKYAATMPRVMLRYAVEHLPKKDKERYMGAKGG